MNLRSRAVWGVRWTALSALGTNALSVVQLLVVARVLPPSEIGLMALVVVVTSFGAVVSDFGIGSAVVQARDIEPRHLSALFWFNIVSGVVLAVAVASLASVIAGVLDQPDIRAPLIVTATMLVVASLGQQSGYLLERDLRFDLIARAELAAAVVGTLVAIVLAFQLENVYALVWGTIVATSVRSLVFVASSGDRSPLIRPAVDGVARYMRFGALHTAQRLVNFLSANADFVLIGRWVNSSALGHYAVAYNLANLPSSRLNPVLGRVFFPVLARIQDDPTRLRRGYLELQRAATTVTFPVIAVLATIAPSLPSLLGEEWRESVVLLQGLCVVGATRAIAGTVGPLILACGRPDLGLRWSLVVVAVQVPAVALGVALGGVRGAVAGFATAQLLLLLINFRLLVRRLSGASAVEYLGAMRGPGVSAVLALGAGLAARVVGQSLMGAAIQVAVVLLSYGGAIALLDRSAVSTLKGALRRADAGTRRV